MEPNLGENLCINVCDIKKFISYHVYNLENGQPFVIPYFWPGTSKFSTTI